MTFQNELKRQYNYDKDTGVFTRLIAKSNRVKVGDVVGYKHPKGYLIIELNGKTYLSHRLAWLYVYGNFPENQIDHINGNKSDNRIENLREATNAENHQNFNRPKSNSKSGIIGVYFDSKRNKWYSHITTNGKLKHLGYFQDKYLAEKAYVDAKRQLHPFNTM